MTTTRVVAGRHECISPKGHDGSNSHDIGDVVRCDDCGRYWVLRWWHLGSGWSPVRWYHLKWRRAIRRAR